MEVGNDHRSFRELRAIQRPAAVVFAYSGASAVMLLLGLPLTKAYGLPGTMVGLCAANAIATLIGAWLFRRKTEPSSEALSRLG